MIPTPETVVRLADKRSDLSKLEGVLEGERPPRVDPGEYDLVFKFHETRLLFRRSPKVVAYFQIVSPGPQYGVVLPRWYNVKALTSKPRRGGSFKLGWHCDLIREYVTVFGVPQRFDRISLSRYSEVVVLGAVGLVETNSRNRVIPDDLRYTVIQEIRGRAV